MRKLTTVERESLIQRGCNASSWDDILVSDDFVVEQLSGVRFGGAVEIGSKTIITDSYVANYRIGADCKIENVTRLECRKATSFGNGVEVAPINENGGRRIFIYDTMSAQVAYIWAMYRHRKDLDEALTKMVESYAAERRSTMGHIGDNCQIIGARFVRESWLADGVVVDGASLVENVTLLSGVFVGVDVKLRDLIVAEDARVDSGSILSRCFIGERAIIAVGFSAVDSLFFANSHLENGEAAAIFAGPCTVSHHKSSLLIAGLFSFFNAGSGTNQSNHLFKCGAVHQAIHSRGSKFASGAYVMAPAREGAFTMIKGRHSHHHDTSAFPYSYLIENSGRSILIPAISLTSYGTRRDIDKWISRDRRTVYRDVVNYEEFNPYITSAMVRGVNALHKLQEHNGIVDDEYIWERVVIRRTHLTRGLTLYNKAIAASIGMMLGRGEIVTDGDIDLSGEWLDIAGAYLPNRFVDSVIESVVSDKMESLESINIPFKAFSQRYDDYAHTWAMELLEQLIGHIPSGDDIEMTRSSAQRIIEEIRSLVDSDREKDCSMDMAVGYGNDSMDESIRRADYNAVRGL